MKTDKPMITKVLKHLSKYQGVPTNDKILFVEDLPEDEVGKIVLAEVSQSAPHSGVVVAVPPGFPAGTVGLRLYYRPFTDTQTNLGPDSAGVLVNSIHKSDVLLYEKVLP